MVLDFSLHDLRHQAVNGASTGCDLLQHGGTAVVLLNCLLNAVELSLQAINASNEFLLGCGDMTHLFAGLPKTNSGLAEV